MIDFYSEFKDYATKHMGVSGLQFHYWEKLQDNIYNNCNIQNSLTPYILEERELRVTQMDIFSRMMSDRIIHLYGSVNDKMMAITQAQLLFLDNLEISDIKLHISSPGGSVLSGLGIVDVMNYISSDVVTVNMGLAASMGSILLSSGVKGKRATLKHSRVMIHQVSSAAQGVISDMEISFKETEKYNNVLFEILAENTGKTKEQILIDANRDFWLNAEEALAYGIVDEIITVKGKK
jgi:ATP-dependent Clp protease protease subunit